MDSCVRCRLCGWPWLHLTYARIKKLARQIRVQDDRRVVLGDHLLAAAWCGEGGWHVCVFSGIAADVLEVRPFHILHDKPKEAMEAIACGIRVKFGVA